MAGETHSTPVGIVPVSLRPSPARGTLRRREARLAWFLLALPVSLVFGMVLYPAAFNVWISLHRVGLDNLGHAWPWAGLKNFEIVLSDWRFLPSLAATVLYSLGSSTLSILLGLAAALLLDREFRGRGVVRGIFLFSFVAPVISVAFIWRWMLEPEGVLNWLLQGIGLLDGPMAFLQERRSALACVIAFEGWRYFPFAMLLILARLQAVPPDLYEAASLDGAGPWRRFLHVTLPELRYILGVLFLLRVLWTFNKFDDVFLLTGGAAGTRVLPILVYEYSFGAFDFGTGAAVAMILFVILSAFLALYVKKVIEW